MQVKLRLRTRALANPIAHTVGITALILLVGLCVGPSSYYGYLITVALLYVIAAIGLDIPAGMLGQLSLGQGASMAVGAYAAAITIVNDHWPLLPALLLCMALGFAVGVLMAIPAGRLGLIGLAIITLGFTLVVTDWVTANASLTGGANGKFGITAPLLSGGSLSGTSLFIVVLTACALSYLAHWKIRLSTFGRSSLAVRDDQLGAAALGISAYRHVVLGFAIGSGIGAVAGGLYAAVTSIVTPDLFGVQLSILILLMVVFGGSGTRVGPVIGAAIIGILPILLASHPSISVYLYGAILIVAMRLLPRGLIRRTAGPVGRRYAIVVHAPGAPPISDSLTATTSGRALTTRDDDAGRDRVERYPVLDVRDVSRSFGGVCAVSHADLSVYPGEVVAIIGSNGSGKTTLLNVVCGYYRADSGTVWLAGRNVTTARPQTIARHGVGRTFQVPKVFPSLSIEEHVALARAQATRKDPEVGRIAIDFLRSATLLDDPCREARTLSQGHLRFLEVGMAVLRAPQVILLDEPAAGLSAEEMLRLGSLLRELADHGVALALIEHHLDWVRSIADRVVVMHLGEQIWLGSPEELLASDVVRNAYLLGVADG